MQESANVVIVGAGIVGCALAYELSQRGWTDILVIDKGPLFETGGSSSHAPGLMFQTNGSKFMTECAKYSVDLYKDLVYNDFQCAYQVGGIEVAYTDARMQELHRKHTIATSYRLESHIITPQEVTEMIPLVNPDVIKGGYYVPTDMDVSGWRCAGAMAGKAMAAGAATFVGNTVVTNILTEDGQVIGVDTANGPISTKKVVLATNVWASVLPKMLGLTYPILGVEHQYVITEPLAELAADKDLFVRHPILRHQDFSLYYRQHGDAYGIGNYRHKSMLFEGDYVGAKAEREFTPEDFAVAERATAELLPALAGKKYTRQFNGFMAFSTDMGPIMGETEVGGLLTCLGVWVTHAGGVAKTMAEWMTDRATEFPMAEGWINRFQPHENTRHWMYNRVDRQYQEVYDVIHPLQQMDNPRGVRQAPYQHRLEQLGGHFHSAAGWEVAHWYEENSRLLEEYDEQIPEREGWEAQHWSRIQGAEHLAVRDNAGLFNIANFAKFEVSGAGAVAFLNYVAANQIDKPVGKIVYTALCNKRGGIQADLTITRTAKDKFMVLTGGGTGPADLAWLKLHAPDDGSVHIEDVTSRYTGIALWGPKARDILQAICEDDVSNEAFPYFTARPLKIGPVPAYALRLSYAGELGWEIYCPSEYGAKLWDMLWGAGEAHGAVALGNGAFGSLRIEKGYRAVGSDLTTDYNPYEAGIGWAVRLKKGDFLGRDALVEARKNVTKKLVCITSDDPQAMALGKEPVSSSAGQTLGYITSANYGYSVGKFIAYAYVPVAFAAVGTVVEVQYLDRAWVGEVSADPQYDAGMERLKR